MTNAFRHAVLTEARTGHSGGGSALSGQWTSIESEAGQTSDEAKTFPCSPRTKTIVSGCTRLSLSGAEHRAATLFNGNGLRYRARLLKYLPIVGNPPAKM